MKYENPNNAAFFFDDGDFLNLEEVSAFQWLPNGDPSLYVAVDSEPIDAAREPVLYVYFRGADTAMQRSGADVSAVCVQRLSDALRVYHSKL